MADPEKVMRKGSGAGCSFASSPSWSYFQSWWLSLSSEQYDKTMILHSPGCATPDELCAPHPTGISDVFWTYYNHPELLVVVTGIVLTVAAIGLYRGRVCDSD